MSGRKPPETPARSEVQEAFSDEARTRNKHSSKEDEHVSDHGETEHYNAHDEHSPS